MGAFDSFGRSLNAIFENRPPWAIHHAFGRIYNVLLVRTVAKGSVCHSS
jgi:hypothetical protein